MRNELHRIALKNRILMINVGRSEKNRGLRRCIIFMYYSIPKPYTHSHTDTCTHTLYIYTDR